MIQLGFIQWDWNGTVQFILTLFILRMCFDRKSSALRSVLNAAGFAIAHTVVNSGIVTLNRSTDFLPDSILFFEYVVLSVLLAWAYAKTSLRVNWKQSLSLTLYAVCDISLIYMVTLVFIITREEPLSETWSAVGYIIGYSISILFAVGYRKVTKTIKSTVSPYYWAINFVTPFIITVLLNLLRIWAGAQLIMPMGLILLLLNNFIYFLSMRLIEENERQTSLALSNQSLAFQIRQMESIEVLLKASRKERHELKNNYFYIETQLEQGNYDEIRDYLYRVVKPSFEKDELILTGNRFMDMLLTQKVSEARADNIPVVINVILPEHIGIRQQMLSSLISNLLDNAIEASRKVKTPDIQFSMHEQKGYLAIEVRNRIDDSVLANNKRLHTSKRDSKNHGIGMSIIRQIVEAYQGNLSITEENNYFVVSIMLLEEKD